MMIAIVLYQNLFGQIEYENSEIYLKNDSLIIGDVLFPDSNPSEILINNEYLIKIKSIDYIKNESYLLRNINTNGIEKLLMAIVEGDSLNLYKEKDIKLFYVVKNGEVYKLEGGKILVENESGSYYINTYKYRGVLKYLSNNKIELQRETENIKYTENDLALFVKKYNYKLGYIKSIDKQKDKYFSKKEIVFQYSYIKNNLYYRPNPNTSPNFYELGIRAYVKEGSRSSISTSIQFGRNTWEYDGHYVDIMQFNFNYMVDFYKTKNADLYLNIRLLDATYFWDEFGNSFNVGPRFNVGFGYRYYIINKINLFIELNQLLNISKIPSNFSFGISYIL